MSAPALRLEDVTVVYRRGRPPAVNKVSLEVPEGSIVGIVGESGSGKTSIGMVAAGLWPVTSGTITSRDQPVTTSMSRAQRATIQMVFQDPQGSMDPRQTVGGMFRELRRLHPEASSWIADEALMERVGLSAAHLGRLPHQLSGGQAQRVCVARALLLRPRLLIADEPTSALDVSVQAQILELLQSIRRDEGLGILFISHDLAVTRSLCDDVYVMQRGSVVESGSAVEVMDNPQHEYTRSLLAAIPGRERRAHLGASEPAPQQKKGDRA